MGTSMSSTVPRSEIVSFCSAFSSTAPRSPRAARSSRSSMGPKSRSFRHSVTTITRDRIAYRLKGIVEMNAAKSLSKCPVACRLLPTAAAQEETGAMMQTGAAVESIM